MKTTLKTQPKRSSSADSRATSLILSPVKEERDEFKNNDGKEENQLFSATQQSYIQDLLEQQARHFARQNEENNDLRERQMDRMMEQMSDMNHRMLYGMPPQGSYATPQQAPAALHEKVLMETPKVSRPHDIAYHELMQSSEPPKTPANTPATPNNSLEASMETLLTSMGSFLTNSSKKDDNTTELPKFHGGDAQWPQWYQLLRSYLQAKGWLSTFDHVTGPGTLANPTPDFDLDKNTKIYQKLHSKCYEGTASTYVRMAAEFDGHGAGKQLKERYNKKSPQQLESYKKLAREHRHVSGTSMPQHIDQFETILGFMPDCGYIPTSTEKIDWFMPTVSENTYDSVRAICLAQKIQGTLVWSEMVLLFNHTCFAKYPHFQLAELKHNKVSNNSSRVLNAYTTQGGNKATKCVLHPDGNHTTAECNKLRNLKGQDKGKGKRTDKNPRHQIKSYQSPAYPQKGKGTGRRQGGKGKGKQPSMGSRTPRTDITCDHCQKKGHVARDCYTRQNGQLKVLTQAVTTTNERSPLIVEF